jgi:hypothetical protein
MENEQPKPVDYGRILDGYLKGRTPGVSFDPAILDFHIKLRTVQALESIRSSLTFIVLIIIIGIALQILASCGAFLGR